MQVKKFEDAQQVLVEAFTRKLESADSENDRGALLLEFVLQRERLRREVMDPGEKRDEVDRQTLNALADPDSLGPEHSLREGVMRRLVADPEGALRYLETALKQRSTTQAKRGSQPRPRARDSITQAIEEILEEHPNYSAKQVGRELNLRPDIQLLDGEFRNTFDAAVLSEKNLASRVSAAKKRFSG